MLRQSNKQTAYPPLHVFDTKADEKKKKEEEEKKTQGLFCPDLVCRW